MKFLLSLFLICLLSFLGGIYFPWWTIAIAACLVTVVLRQRPVLAFISGFLALFLLWGFMAYQISVHNGHILAHKISLLIIKSDQPLLLIGLTAVLGGIVAGFAALTGSLLCRLGRDKALIRPARSSDSDLK